MHELPSDLSNSLRSFRGSIYGASRASQQREVDLERGGASARTTREHGDEHSIETLKDGRKHAVQHDFSHSKASEDQDTPQRPKKQSQDAAAKQQAASSPGITPTKQSVFHAAPVSDPDPAADRLAEDDTPLTDDEFHQLMGMRKPTNVREEGKNEKYPFKLATKHGLYRTIYEDLRYIQYKYRIFDTMTYVLLALQIALGAGFIVLGAVRNTSNVVIAVLGAISTVVGGVLALMKGQGLPNRLRQGRNQMRNVLFEAEELYWDFRSGRDILYRDVKRVREDYLRVLEEMRRDHPDTWTGAAGAAAQPRSLRSKRT